MSIHIGKEILRVLQERGMTKARFAERIGRNRVNIYGLFRSPDCNTAVLRKVCVALDYDFFRMLSNELQASPDKVAEPGAAFKSPGGRTPMRIVIEVDPGDQHAQEAAVKLAERLRDE